MSYESSLAKLVGAADSLLVRQTLLDFALPWL
jgi:hypothetical protein